MEITVDVLRLGHVDLPEWHPRAASDGIAIIRAFLVRHPDGLILFDTGCADDHPFIEEMYSPSVVSPVDALHELGIDERDVAAIANSHLHFDHCGHNRLFPTTPVWVQRAELEVSQQPRYTIAEWAAIPDERRRVVDGDAEIAEGVTLLATPGHTPGHQSLLVESDVGREVVVGQACYTCAAFEAGEVSADNIHDDTWADTAATSLARLRGLGADTVRFSHDDTVHRRTA